MDYEAAVKRIDRLLADIDTYTQSSFDLNEVHYTNRKYDEMLRVVDQLDMGVMEGIAIARVIAQTAGHVKVNSLGPSLPVPAWKRWRPAEGELRTLRAGLVVEEEAQAIVGPKGPAMSATNLHPWIWHAAIDLWNNGHHREAVQKAATALETLTATKLGSTLSGAPLFASAFGSEPPKPGVPRLRFDIPPNTDAWKNQHGGSRDIGQGAMALIRNESTHHTDDLSPDVAFEYLAVLSVMARQVDVAAVQTV